MLKFHVLEIKKNDKKVLKTSNENWFMGNLLSNNKLYLK